MADVVYVPGGESTVRENDLAVIRCGQFRRDYVNLFDYSGIVESFDEMMKEKTLPGLALESNAAFVENGGCISFIASDDLSKAYIIRNVEGNLEKQEQKITHL